MDTKQNRKRFLARAHEYKRLAQDTLEIWRASGTNLQSKLQLRHPRVKCGGKRVDVRPNWIDAPRMPTKLRYD
jgi:hypothetical protein